MVKIEEGKFYKTRDGRKVGPMVISENWATGSVENDGKDDRVFGFDGKHGGPYVGNKSHLDIISEWPSSDDKGPIREVRRREIVDGEYGGIHIRKYDPDHLNVSFDRSLFTAEQLREASHLFAQLAEAMEERR